MAKDKKSFVLYSDSQSLVNQLPDEVAGRLLKHIFAYVNDENPETDELLVNIAFEPIKNQLKRDLKKYEKTIEIKSNGGKLGNLKRWNLDLYDMVINKSLSIEEAEKIAESRKVSHTDVLPSHSDKKIAVTVNDNVTVNVNDNDITSTNVDVVEKEKNVNIDNFQNFKILFYRNLNSDYDFVFEIQKIRNELDLEKNDNQKIYLSQVLNFLIEEKRKKVPEKKENKHLAFVEELKNSSEWLNVISSQLNSSPDIIKSKLDDFKTHLFTEDKLHQTKNEFLRHFKSWVPKNITAKKITEFTHNR